MRYLMLLLILAGLLLACVSCPRDGGEGKQPVTAPPKQTTPPIAQPPVVPETTPAPIVCKYEIDKVMLGATPASLDARWPATDTTKQIRRQWIEEGKTGIVDVAPTGGKPLPGESASFLDGQLITFMRAVEMTEAAYTKEVAGFTTTYGAPAPTAPEWAKDTEFFKSTIFPEGKVIVNIWGDEPNRVTFCAVYDKEKKATVYMLVQVDLFTKFLEKTSPTAGQPPAEGAMPPAAGGTPPAEGTTPPGAPKPPAKPAPPAGGK